MPGEYIGPLTAPVPLLRKLVAATQALSGGGGGGGSFSALTSGTNTLAAMRVGTGASLAAVGAGTIDATSLLTKTWASPAAIGTGTPADGTFLNLAGLVTATGSTTARTLADRFNSPVNILDFGGDNTGTLTNTAALNAACTYLNGTLNNGGIIFFPRGTYLFNTKPNAIVGGITLVGEGMAKSYLYRNYTEAGAAVGFIDMTASASLSNGGGGARDLGIYALTGTSGGAAIAAVSDAAVTQGVLTFENLWISGVGTWNYPVYLDGSAKTVAPVGIRDVSFHNCYLFQADIEDFYANSVEQLSITAGGFFATGGNATAGITITGTPSVPSYYVNINAEFCTTLTLGPSSGYVNQAAITIPYCSNISVGANASYITFTGMHGTLTNASTNFQTYDLVAKNNNAAAGASNIKSEINYVYPDAGGTSSPTGYNRQVNFLGSANFNSALGEIVNVINGNTGTTSIMSSGTRNTYISAAGSVTTLRGMQESFILNGAGNNTGSATYRLVSPPTVSSTGDFLGTIIVDDVGNVGRASATTITIYNVQDQTKGSGNLSAYCGQITAGAGKYNLNMTGTAANYFAGPLVVPNVLNRVPSTITVTAGAGTIKAAAGYQQAAVVAATNLTFDGNGNSGDFVTLDITADSTLRVVTIKNSGGSTIATVSCTLSLTTTVVLRSTGAAWVLVGGSPSLLDASASTTPASTVLLMTVDPTTGVVTKSTIAQVATPANIPAGALVDGMTATTQAIGDNDTSVATTAFANAAAAGTATGSFGTPSQVSASPTWVSPVLDIYLSTEGGTPGTRTITLPAAASYTGKAICITCAVAATSSRHLNFLTGTGAIAYLAGVIMTSGHYIQLATPAAGNYMYLKSDGVNWISAGSSGTWTDASGA